MRKDRARFLSRLRRLKGKEHLEEQEIQKLSTDVALSVSLAEKRRQSIPVMTYDESLPVSQQRDKIAETIRDHQVVVICGETGSGKSTQLPKICLELGLGITGIIGHTQPRRIAASSIAHRLSQEIPGGKNLVGYKIRFTDRTSPETCIKLMTDGILLAETQSDRDLEQYDVIIIDEAHERSLNIDFLIGILRRITERRHDLKVIITSATIDARRFAEHFSTSEGKEVPVIEISGRTYPVEVIYQPLLDEEDEPQEASRDFYPIQETENSDHGNKEYRDGKRLREDGKWEQRNKSDFQRDGDIHKGVIRAISHAAGMGQGDMLVFMPTERDIHEVVKMLHGEKQRRGMPLFIQQDVEILPLYARLPAPQQQKIFDPGTKRRIVIATNVAESSVTVPRIRYVIDTGTARISRYSARTKIQRLPVEPVSQASAEQRKGRCGRIGPGVCIRLYSETDFCRREKYTQPEIQRTNLASVILQTKVFKLGNIETFPFIDPPQKTAIRDGYKTLFEIGAITEPSKNGEVTPLGRQLSRLPVDPRIGRMIIAGIQEARKNTAANSLQEILIIAAALEIRDPRERPLDHQSEADAAHMPFLDSRSDFVGLLRLWNFYHHLKRTLSRNQLIKACRQNFLSWNRMREWTDMFRQFSELTLQLLKEMKEPIHFLHGDATHLSVGDGHETNILQEKYTAIHRAILAGTLSNLGHKSETSKEYLVGGGGKCFLWPGSGVFKKSTGESSVSDLSVKDTKTRYAPKAGNRFWGRNLDKNGLPETKKSSVSENPSLSETAETVSPPAKKIPLPAWVVAAEMVETTKRYMRCVAEINPEWAEMLAPHLISKTYSAPHWSKSNNNVMVYEKVTLFGLPIIPKRRIPYGRIAPTDARELFIRHGLVEGMLNTNLHTLKFYSHNQELMEHLEQLQAKLRRHDFLPGDWKLYDFYDKRIPMEVYDLPSLEKWISHLRTGKACGPDGSSGEHALQSLYMTEQDILSETVDNEIFRLFPDTFPGISDTSHDKKSSHRETSTKIPAAPLKKNAIYNPSENVMGHSLSESAEVIPEGLILFGKKVSVKTLKPTSALSAVSSKQEETLSPKFSDKKNADIFSEKNEANFEKSSLSRQTFFPLEYRFEPGMNGDGVTLRVSLETINQVDSQQLAWGIPGLLEERITALIKTLPKEKRRKLVPAPDTARCVREKIIFGQGNFLRILASELTRLAGEIIHPEELHLDAISPELQINIRVVDKTGKTLAENRDYDEILRILGQRTAERFEAISDSRWHRENLKSWDFGPLPFQVEVHESHASKDKSRIIAYPMLVDTGKSVNLRLGNTLYQAESSSRHAIIRLFRLAANKELLQQAQWFPGLNEMKNRAFPFLSSAGTSMENLIADAMANAVCRPAGISSLSDLPSLLINIPRDKAQFENLCRQGRTRISLVAQDIGPCLSALWNAYHNAIKSLDSLYAKKSGTSSTQVLKIGSARLSLSSPLPSSELKQMSAFSPAQKVPAHTNFQQTITDISLQLSRLMPANFLLSTPWEHLRHYSRYLQGIVLRVETLKNANSGVRQLLAVGKQHMDELEEFWQQYENLRQDFYLRGISSEELENFRWLLEEYRISIFAQKLGTNQSVSAKRLKKIWETLLK
ncbi:MAG: DUF3418 domain-containing protein [Planctomycetia bacterium]|nr:DUF3418 domain-containing protein [Planctomycetia bacterium]